MQFKVVFALTFATLAAAGALPRADTNPNPAKTNPANTNTNPAKTNPANTNTNPAKTNTNPGTTKQVTKIAPPVPGKDTIGASECSSGHLRCCKSALSPSAPAVTPLLPSGYSADDISGLVGITCAALPAGAKPKDCPEAPVCCTDNSHGTLSLGCNKVKLSA